MWAAVRLLVERLEGLEVQRDTARCALEATLVPVHINGLDGFVGIHGLGASLALLWLGVVWNKAHLQITTTITIRNTKGLQVVWIISLSLSLYPPSSPSTIMVDDNNMRERMCVCLVASSGVVGDTGYNN
jgi:hypothetical protein